MQPEQKELRLGLLAGVGAHVLWGTFPLFWRQLNAVDALEVVAHRVVWAFVFLLAASPLIYRSFPPQTRKLVRDSIGDSRALMTYALAAVLVGINWLTFIWAVNHERVLEASLGYYINPLLNVLLGVIVLSERLSKLQWLAVGIAAIGVGVMTVAGGGLPWVSLVLAFSFATYGLVKKKATLPVLVGLLLENAALLVPAIAMLFYIEATRGGELTAGNTRILTFLVLGGLVTIAPLSLFAFAAKRVPLSTIGLLQYIGPTMQLLIGILILDETFDGYRLVGFVFVWIALAVYLYSTQVLARDARAKTRMAAAKST